MRQSSVTPLMTANSMHGPPRSALADAAGLSASMAMSTVQIAAFNQVNLEREDPQPQIPVHLNEPGQATGPVRSSR
jgi:hypothetical protein